jgi:hypothetical protein
MSTSILVLYIGLGAIAIVIVYALIRNRNDNKLQEEKYREFWNVKKDGDDDIGYHPDPIPPGSESIFIPSLSVKIIDFYQERYGLLCQWEDQTDAGQIIVVRLKPPSMVKSIKELTDTSHLGLFLGRDGISVNLDSGSLIIEVPKKRSKPLLLGRLAARNQRGCRSQPDHEPEPFDCPQKLSRHVHRYRYRLVCEVPRVHNESR